MALHSTCLIASFKYLALHAVATVAANQYFVLAKPLHVHGFSHSSLTTQCSHSRILISLTDNSRQYFSQEEGIFRLPGFITLEF